MFEKKTCTKNFWPLAILLGAGIAALVVTTCTLGPDLDTIYQNAMDKLGYTVTFNGHGATLEADPATIVVQKDETIGAGNMPLEPVKSGNTFVNWNTAENGSGTEFDEDTPVTEKITVYAQWTPVATGERTVIFDSNGGTHAVPRIIVLPAGTTTINASSDSMPADPTRAGFEFVEWNEESDGSGATFTDFTVVTAHIVVHGVWIPARINLDPGSDAGAAAGDKKITGLNAGSFYKVITNIGTRYAKADGTLTPDLELIEPLTGTEITGLTNGPAYTYKVNAATPYNDAISVTYQVEDVSIDFVRGARNGPTNIPTGTSPDGDLKLADKGGTDPGLYGINIGDFFAGTPRLGTLAADGLSNTTKFQYIAYGRAADVGPFYVAYGDDGTGYKYVSDNSTFDPDGIYIWELKGYQSATATTGPELGIVQKYIGYEFYFPTHGVVPRTYLFSCDNGDFVYLKISYN